MEMENQIEEQETITQEEQNEGEQPEVSEEENVEPSYEPKFKYKVRDEEYDMEDWVKGYIKDEETEKRFIDLFTRGHGLELSKKERDEYKGKFEGLEQAINHVAGLAHEGKIDRFISELGLPEKAFIDYAINKLRYSELPEDKRREIDLQKQRELQVEQQGFEYQQMQEAYRQQQVDLRSMQLEQALSKPEYAEAERLYDQSVGTPGSFRNLIVERGSYHWAVNQRDISVDQAIQEAIQIGRINVGASQPINTAPSADAVRKQTEKPVVTNLKGTGSSPVRKVFTSIDDIRAHANSRG